MVPGGPWGCSSGNGTVTIRSGGGKAVFNEIDVTYEYLDNRSLLVNKDTFECLLDKATAESRCTPVRVARRAVSVRCGLTGTTLRLVLSVATWWIPCVARKSSAVKPSCFGRLLRSYRCLWRMSK